MLGVVAGARLERLPGGAVVEGPAAHDGEAQGRHRVQQLLGGRPRAVVGRVPCCRDHGRVEICARKFEGLPIHLHVCQKILKSSHNRAAAL